MTWETGIFVLSVYCALVLPVWGFVWWWVWRD